MAFVFFYGQTSEPSKGAWVDMEKEAILDAIPTAREMIYDVIISQAKIESDTNEIYLLLNDLKSQRKKPENNIISEKRLKKHFENHTFKQTLKMIVNEHDIDKKYIIEDLETMADLRNEIAHGQFIEELFNGEKILRIVDDFGKGFEISMGTQKQAILSSGMGEKLEDLFKRYTGLCWKHSNYFFAKPAEKIKMLRELNNE